MVRILQTWWFTTCDGAVLGIVKTYDEITKEEKFRIGRGMGIDENADAEYIAKTGDHFEPEEIG